MEVQRKKITQGDDWIKFDTNEYQILFKGKFPNFSLFVTENDNELINIQTQSPKQADAIEFFGFEKANFGVEIGNTYLDFEGKLGGETFVGRSYMQKVIMSAPFVPWYWGRFVFENGSVLVFFLLWIEVAGIKKTLYSQAKIYDIDTNTYIKIDSFDVKNIKNTSYWIMTHDSEDYNFFVLIDAYASNVFTMKSKGEFTYNEMFAEVKEIKIQLNNKILDNAVLGKGSGSLEAANGIAF